MNINEFIQESLNQIVEAIRELNSQNNGISIPMGGIIGEGVQFLADKKGKTKFANIKLYNKEINSEDKLKMEKEINKWFLHKIRWRKNDTRMNADWIKIYYKSSKTELFIQH